MSRWLWTCGFGLAGARLCLCAAPVYAATLAAPGYAASAGLPQEESELPEVEGPRDPIFERTPDDLPHADPGRWDGWTGQAEPPPELAEWIRTSQRAYLARDFPTALQGLYAILETAPDYPPALFQMGTVYYRLHRYGDGRTVLRRFLEVAPQEVAITQALAHCEYSLGNYAAAVEHYEVVLGAGIASLEAHRGLGLARMRLGDFEGALDELELVVGTDPTDGDAWAWIARIYYDLGRSEDALEPARKGVEHLHYEPRPWFVLSQVLYDLEQDEEAEDVQARFEELTRLVQIVRHEEARLLFDPHNVDALQNLVRAHHDIGDLGSVRTTLARAFQARPGDCQLRFWSLEVLLDMQDEEGAKVSARALEQACGDDVETWKKLEQFYGRVREFEEQVRCGERYLRLGGKPR